MVAVLLVAMVPLEMALTFRNPYLLAAFRWLGTGVLFVLVLRELKRLNGRTEPAHGLIPQPCPSV